MDSVIQESLLVPYKEDRCIVLGQCWLFRHRAGVLSELGGVLRRRLPGRPVEGQGYCFSASGASPSRTIIPGASLPFPVDIFHRSQEVGRVTLAAAEGKKGRGDENEGAGQEPD